MFVLTREEKRVICFVMLAILVGIGVQHYRRQEMSKALRKPTRPSELAAQQQPASPAPADE